VGTRTLNGEIGDRKRTESMDTRRAHGTRCLDDGGGNEAAETADSLSFERWKIASVRIEPVGTP